MTVMAASAEGGHALETPETRNVVIFGDSGVGKSSLINMLAGRRTAETSNGALGCTFESRQYLITIDGQNVNVWDTAGLNEGMRGRVLPKAAEKNLIELLRELRDANGVHLLVYCIRGPSIQKSLARNYAIFYSAICRKKVPIVAVVTGLENEPASMDDWWFKSEKQLAKYKMRFNAHACVTTIDMDKAKGSVFEERSFASQQLVRKLIVDHGHHVAIRPPSDANVLIRSALLDLRSMMRSRWESVQPVCTVVFCQSDVLLVDPRIFGNVWRITSQIDERTFVFQHSGDLSERYIPHRISKGGADLLIFAGTMSDPNVEKLRSFYTRCNGEVCPLLVVTDYISINAWRERLAALGIGARVAPIRPSSIDMAELSSLIDELHLVRGPAKYHMANLFRFLGLKSSDEVAKED